MIPSEVLLLAKVGVWCEYSSVEAMQDAKCQCFVPWVLAILVTALKEGRMWWQNFSYEMAFASHVYNNCVACATCHNIPIKQPSQAYQPHAHQPGFHTPSHS